ncbi:glycine--tRNA ligase subunit beta, partial [Candidatus Bipolaricaulota bacterium]|nr:glycine--tRNA ligase subunit beta [Candidatus Bipolaricaulota bacterium]
AYGVPYDIVNAVNSGQNLEPLDTYLKARALVEYKERPEMNEIVDSFTRLVNITEGTEKGEFSPDLFQLEEERKLWQAVESRKERLESLLEEGSYEEVIEELLDLKDPIDAYFDNVMVMADEDAQRENRVNFLLYLKQQFIKLGDLSQVVTE